MGGGGAVPNLQPPYLAFLAPLPLFNCKILSIVVQFPPTYPATQPFRTPASTTPTTPDSPRLRPPYPPSFHRSTSNTQ